MHFHVDVQTKGYTTSQEVQNDRRYYIASSEKKLPKSSAGSPSERLDRHVILIYVKNQPSEWVTEKPRSCHVRTNLHQLFKKR